MLKIRRLLAGLTLLTTGCSVVQLKVPMPEIQLPQVAEHISFGVAGNTSRDVVLSNDAEARPPAFTSPRSDASMDLSGFLNFTLWSRLQIGEQCGMLTGVCVAQAKLQILGEPMSKDPKAGEFDLAVAGRYGTHTVANSGSQLYAGGPGGYPWVSRATLNILGYGGSLGYYLSPWVMFFGGYMYDVYQASGLIDQQAAADGSSGAATVSESLTGSAVSIGGGVRINLKVFAINASYADLQFKWTGQPDIHESIAYLGFDLHF